MFRLAIGFLLFHTWSFQIFHLQLSNELVGFLFEGCSLGWKTKVNMRVLPAELFVRTAAKN